jgi:hypothetical protein
MLNNYYNAERASAGTRVPTAREDLDTIAIMLASFNGTTREPPR